MTRFEEKLRPPMLARPAWRDRAGLVFFVAMAVVVIGSLYETLPGPADASLAAFIRLISREMASYYLLPVLGMLVALRRGAIDLSVWAVCGFGGLVAAGLINAGVPPLWAMIIAGVVGAAVGLVSGLLTAMVKIPSFIATLAVGAVLVVVMRIGWPGGQVRIHEYAFGNWLVLPNATLLITRMLLVGSVYSVVMAAMMVSGWSLWRRYDYGQLGKLGVSIGVGLGASLLAAVLVSREFAGSRGGSSLGSTMMEGWAWIVGVGAALAGLVRLSLSPVGSGHLSRPRPSLVLAMCVSGSLCAIGGVASLMDQSVAPVIRWPIEDLRIPLAAIIAGGAFWAGSGRSLLAGACLPTALLIAMVWWENGPQFTLGGYELQMVLLGVMVIVTQMALARATSSRFGDAYCKAAAGLTACGTVVAASAVYYPISVHRGLVAVTAGAGVWLLGTILMMIARTTGTATGRRL